MSTRKYSNISLNILKDGENVTSHARQRTSARFNMWIFDFPEAKDTIMNSKGSWTITLSGNNPFPYNLAAIADDHYLNYNCELNKTIFTVGDTIKISARLRYLGKSLTGISNSVKAILLKPGDDIGQLLSEFPTPVPDTTDKGSDASAKFESLMANDTSFYNALLPDEQVVTLAGDGNELFTGMYTNTDLTGIYNVIFLINGETPHAGKFERTKIVSSVFKFGQVVSETPVVTDSGNTGTATTPGTNPPIKNTSVTIRPKNIYGNLMGPGFASKIKVVINPGKHQQASMISLPAVKTTPFVREIYDNLDGSYTIVISGIPGGTNPRIQIFVRDEQLYKGKTWPVPWWYYLILALLLILLFLIRYIKSINYKTYRILVWILTILILLLIVLHKLGIFRLFA